MWRDQIDAFWDGRRTLAVGFFAGGKARGALRSAPEITAVSARDSNFADQATLVDVIDVRRWRSGHCVLPLPKDHSYVSLRSPDGAEICFALTGEQSSYVGGELRMLLAETPANASNAPLDYHLASLSARGNLERLTQDRIARSGSRLVWAIGQRRHVERQGGAAQLVYLWPAQLVFPGRQSRIVIEAVDSSADSAPAALRAPFAIMENWLRETGAPCATLRLRVPASLDQNDALLARTGVALVMHQRRRLRQWTREQKFFGGPTVDLLTFDDIRQATGRTEEHPDAVEADGAIIVHNLATLVSNPKASEFDGVSVRRHVENAGPQAGLLVDVEFFAAALGDDVGLVSTAADAGDFGVLPSDPGGAPYVRLFRVEADGLQPRRIEDNDALLDEILRLAAREERSAAGLPPHAGDRAAESQRQREKLLVEFNALLSAAGYFGRFHAAKLWDLFEPLLMSNFVALATDAAPEARAMLLKLGGYEAYLSDPSLIEALLRGGEFARDADEKSFQQYRGASKSLVYRVAGAAHVPNLVVGEIDLPTQIHIWRLLTQASNARRLTTAGIALTSTDDVTQNAFHAADLLIDEDMVQRAAAYCDAANLPHGPALRDYLMRRKHGGWTSLDEAGRLAVIVEEANAYWRRHEAEEAASAAEPARQQQKSGGLLAAVKNFFSRRAGNPPS